MAVKRVVANICAEQLDDAKRFYGDILGMTVVMEIYRRVLAAGIAAEYGPTNEPWGVMRFYVRDPFGRLVNIMTHR